MTFVKFQTNPITTKYFCSQLYEYPTVCMFHIQFIPYCIYIHERLYLHGVAVRLLWKSNRCRRKSCTAYNRYNTQHTLFESQSGFQIFSRRCSLPHIYANAQGKPKPKVALKNSILMRRISNVHLLISLSLAAFFALVLFFFFCIVHD